MTLLLAAAGSCPAETNFSQYPGFAEFFAANPPSATPVSAESRPLLERFRPDFRLPPDHPGLVDFYGDYIAEGDLLDANGRLVSKRVTRAVLNAYKNEPRVEFRHRPDTTSNGTPAVYARIDRDKVLFQTDSGVTRQTFTFLTYHAVFRHSGLPAGLPGWKAVFLNLAGDLSDWHQLDHYTAVTLILDDRLEPVAVMLQQHNYHHTYLIGEGIELPSSGRVRVDVAIRSNELYPHQPSRRMRRAVRFASPEGMAYLMGFGNQPFVSADDVTHGESSADYRLEYLAHNDAFYLFAGFLGERRQLPGRSGPPGAAYNTLPSLKPLGRQMLSGYWREGNSGDWQRYRTTVESGEGLPGFAERQSAVFYANWMCLKRGRVKCELE